MQNLAVDLPKELSIEDYSDYASNLNQPLFCHSDSGTKILLYPGATTIALSREIQNNTLVAIDLAVGVALQYPGRAVVFVNSYAGKSLMCHGLLEAMKHHNVEHHSSDTTNALRNLHFVEVKIDQWSTDFLRSMLEKCSGYAEPPVLIFNSFEFLVLNRNRRPRYVRELLRLVADTGATMLLFSHDTREDMIAGHPASGALGIVAAQAAEIVRPFSRMRTFQLGDLMRS